MYPGILLELRRQLFGGLPEALRQLIKLARQLAGRLGLSSLRGRVKLAFSTPEEARLEHCDVVFFATPNGVAMQQVRPLLDAGVKVIDLAADFRIKDIALWEINEAFASVPAYAARMLGIDPAIVNVNGGAVAFGHPIGASGARIILTLALELRRRGGGLGVAAICSGTAQGDAVVIEVEPS